MEQPELHGAYQDPGEGNRVPSPIEDLPAAISAGREAVQEAALFISLAIGTGAILAQSSLNMARGGDDRARRDREIEATKRRTRERLDRETEERERVAQERLARERAQKDREIEEKKQAAQERLAREAQEKARREEEERRRRDRRR